MFKKSQSLLNEVKYSNVGTSNSELQEENMSQSLLNEVKYSNECSSAMALE